MQENVDAKPSTYYLWCDLETTGGIDGIDGHRILEAAFMLTTTDPALGVVLSWWDYLLNVPDADAAVDNMPPVVRAMHMKNGLLVEWMNADGMHGRRQRVYPSVADKEAAEKISAVLQEGDKLILAGSGVSRFDRAFLKRDFPEVTSMLEYYEFDTSSVRRGVQNAGFHSLYPKVGLSGEEAGKVHRAGDDLLDSHYCAATFFLNLERLMAGPSTLANDRK